MRWGNKKAEFKEAYRRIRCVSSADTGHRLDMTGISIQSQKAATKAFFSRANVMPWRSRKWSW